MLGIHCGLHVVGWKHALGRLHEAHFRFCMAAQFFQSQSGRTIFHPEFVFAVAAVQTFQITFQQNPLVHAGYTAGGAKLAAIDGHPLSPNQPHRTRQLH